MHNAEKPNPPASVRDTGGQGELLASSNTRARNSLRAVATHNAPSPGVHGERKASATSCGTRGTCGSTRGAEDAGVLEGQNQATQGVPGTLYLTAGWKQDGKQARS